METEYKEYESLSFSSTIENLSVAESLIDKTCSELKLKEDHYANILIAVTEAVNNAIKHGNNEDPNKNVSILVFDKPKKLEVVVSDQGQGFDFNSLPDPTAPENIEKEHGRGIFLMKTLSDDVEFIENGRKVVLSFNK